MLLIMIPDQYPNYYMYKALQIYTGYFDSLDYDTFFLSQQYRNNERPPYLTFLHWYLHAKFIIVRHAEVLELFFFFFFNVNEQLINPPPRPPPVQVATGSRALPPDCCIEKHICRTHI